MALTDLSEREASFLQVKDKPKVGPGQYDANYQFKILKKRTTSMRPPPFMTGEGISSTQNDEWEIRQKEKLNALIKKQNSNFTPGPGKYNLRS